MYDRDRQRFWEILEDLTHAHKNLDDETKEQEIRFDGIFNH